MAEEEVADGGVPPPRRRALDRTWQVEQELDFREESSPRKPREPITTADLGIDEDPTVSAMLSVPGKSTSSPSRLTESNSATLRRLKQLEADVVCSIENECGISVKRGVEVFRLVLLNSEQKALRRSTRVLLIAQEAFLCEDPRPGAESEAFHEAPSTTEAKMKSQSWINLDLRFFRATPKGGGKLGRSLPVLHLTLSTNDGQVQAIEFIGKHQRQYYAEDSETASDALSHHLTESLLRVALEFVFHPSRNKFAKELVVVRECSVEAEALHRREELLPKMLETVRGNDSVKDVILELGGQLYLPKQKEKSFVVLDEDVLKVVPAKEQVKADQGQASTAFQGFGKGFLNNKELKGSPQKAVPALCPGNEDTGRMESQPVPPNAPPVSTSMEEKRQLLMPAASPAPGAAQHRALVSTLAADPPEPEEEPEEFGEALNISQLASQLFGEDSGSESPAPPVPAPPAPPEDVAQPGQTERDDLVALWLKQRW